MLKSKSYMFTITFLIFVISLTAVQSNYAKTNEISDWKVIITSDTKDLEETHEIKFKAEENPNVVKGKLAPGLKAHATVEVDLSQIKEDTDICLSMENKALLDTFRFTINFNGKLYESDTIVTVKCDASNPIQIFDLELEWVGDNDQINTFIGATMNEIQIPITIYVSQSI